MPLRDLFQGVIEMPSLAPYLKGIDVLEIKGKMLVTAVFSTDQSKISVMTLIIGWRLLSSQTLPKHRCPKEKIWNSAQTKNISWI